MSPGVQNPCPLGRGCPVGAMPAALPSSHSSCCPAFLGSWPSSEPNCSVPWWALRYLASFPHLPFAEVSRAALWGWQQLSRWGHWRRSLVRAVARICRGRGAGEQCWHANLWLSGVPTSHMAAVLAAVTRGVVYGRILTFCFVRSPEGQGLWYECFQANRCLSPLPQLSRWLRILYYVADSAGSTRALSPTDMWTWRLGCLDLGHIARTFFFSSFTELLSLNPILFPLWHLASAGEPWMQYTSLNLHKKGWRFPFLSSPKALWSLGKPPPPPSPSRKSGSWLYI